MQRERRKMQFVAVKRDNNYQPYKQLEVPEG